MATQERRQQWTAAQPAPGIGCKRSDILNLALDDYQKWADKVEAGFEAAAKYLCSQPVRVYGAQRSIQYPSGPLGGPIVWNWVPSWSRRTLRRSWNDGIGRVCSVKRMVVRLRLSMLGHLVEVADYVRNGTEPTLMREANFTPSRLISLRTRQSAAYKGLYALQMKSGAADWRTGQPLRLAIWHNENVDIHHIFPKTWTSKQGEARDSGILV